MLYFYTKEFRPKLIDCLEMDIDTLAKINISDFVPEIKDINSCIVSEGVKFENPIYIDGLIREMTRYELVTMDNRMDLLYAGENIVDCEIIYTEPPKDMIDPNWNKEKREWYDEVKGDYATLVRKNKILKLIDVRKEISLLESFGEAEMEIQMLKEQENKLTREIEDLKEKQNK